jgi:hypothetical protein
VGVVFCSLSAQGAKRVISVVEECFHVCYSVATSVAVDFHDRACKGGQTLSIASIMDRQPLQVFVDSLSFDNEGQEMHLIDCTTVRERAKSQIPFVIDS